MGRISALRLVILFILVGLLGISCPPRPTGDYGDAPDDEPAYPALVGTPARLGAFPSLYDSANVRAPGNTGIVHLDADPPLTLGATIDQESDARIVDNDSDDAAPTLVIGGLGNNGRFFVNVSAAPGNVDNEQVGFLNVLLDLNQDGTWAEHTDSGTQVPEWIVQNFPVSVREGGLERVLTPDFQFGPTSRRTVLWSRFTLTPQPIDAAQFAAIDGWDGSGPAAGYDEGETEDWFFPCEGSLDIAYPLTADNFASRITNPAAGAVFATITITNTATVPVVYVFAARAQVAVPFGLGYFYVDINRANPEWTLTLNPVVPPTVRPVGAITPDPDAMFTIEMPAGAVSTFNLTAVNNNIQPVLDPTAPPPPGADNRLARVLFHPLGPCLLRLTKTNDEPVYLQWP